MRSLPKAFWLSLFCLTMQSACFGASLNFYVHCVPNPCENEGVCSLDGDAFVCTCPTGVVGSRCETVTTEWRAGPTNPTCLNGGQLTADNTCNCATGYSGSECETNINDCATNPCQNGGTCIDGVASSSCACSPGWTGSLCNTDVDECQSNACPSGGLCSNTAGSYTCSAMATSNNNTCALKNGVVKCWGDNGDGQLGIGDTTSRGNVTGQPGASHPAVDLGTENGVPLLAKAITAGPVSCAQLMDNSIKCWGNGVLGMLGAGDTDSRGDAPGEMGNALPRIDFGPGRTALRVDGSDSRTCAILDNGRVKCWGYTLNTGLGAVTNIGDEPGEVAAAPYVDLGTGFIAQEISVGVYHICAISSTRTLKCWGANSNAELGLGDTTLRDQLSHMGDNLPTVNLGTATEVLAVSVGARNACAITRPVGSSATTGDVKCWGIPNNGGLGRGDLTAVGSTPASMGDNMRAVNLGSPAHTISCSWRSCCAISADSALRCWGQNLFGRLGVGDTTDRGDTGGLAFTPPVVNLGTGRTAKGVYHDGLTFHTCAILDNNGMKCWGNNTEGQLGQGDTTTRGNTLPSTGDGLPAIVAY